MSASEVVIPPVIEGYSDVRVVWYNADNAPRFLRSGIEGLGGGADLFDVNLNTKDQVQTKILEQNSNALLQLRKLIKFPDEVRGTEWDNGNELMTNGESDVMSMSWNKDIEAPAGVVSLVLFPRRDYSHLMKPEDVLLVWGKGDKHKPATFLALISIDSVRLSRVVEGSGATAERVNIQGRDLGKLLMETPTVYDQAFGGKVTSTFFAQFLRSFTEGFAQGGPSLVVQTMLAIFFSMRQNFVTRTIGAELPTQDEPSLSIGPLRPWRFPGKPTISLFSFIDLSSFVQTPMVGALVADASLLQNGGNLWNLCDMYSNRIVNEFFIDVRDLVDGFDAAHKRTAYFAEKFLDAFGSGQDSDYIAQQTKIDALVRAMTLVPELLSDDKDKPEALNSIVSRDFSQSETSADGAGSVVALVHRQYPYDTFSFYKLPTSLVYETEVFDVSLEHGSHDILNFFRIRFPGLVEGVAQDLQFGLTINRISIEKHGIRRYEGESIYPYVNSRLAGENTINSYQPTFEFYMSCVTAWHAYNERLLSGSIAMRFRPDIRVGTRLTFVCSHRGHIRVFDFYVQVVSHQYSSTQGQSRTTVEIVRGIERASEMTIGDLAEAHLYWSHEGRSLDPDPMEIVVSEDVFGSAREIQVPSTTLAPGDP